LKAFASDRTGTLMQILRTYPQNDSNHLLM
jgi:hypothetical protein